MFGFYQPGGGGPGQVGSWLVILLVFLCALAFVGGMFWVFSEALAEIEASNAKPFKI